MPTIQAVLTRQLGLPAAIRFATLLVCSACAHAGGDGYLWVDQIYRGASAPHVPPATINGKPVRLLLDTGTGESFVLFDHAAKRLELRFSPAAPNGPSTPGVAPATWTSAYALRIFGDDAGQVEFPVVALDKDISTWTTSLPDGMMGWPAMKGAIWVFFLHDRQFYQVSELPEGVDQWDRWSIDPDADTLVLTKQRAESAVRIVVDSGNTDGVMISPEEWRQWQTRHPRSPRTLELEYMAGQDVRPVEEAWAEQFDLGGVTVKDTPVREADPAYARAREQPSDRILALGVAGLRRLQVVLDPQHGFAYLRASPDRADPYPHNRFGVTFTRGETAVRAVVAGGSPADRGGLRTGDVLLAVDGKPAAHWQSKSEWHALTSGDVPAGTQRRYTVSRAGRTLTLIITAEDILGPNGQAR